MSHPRHDLQSLPEAPSTWLLACDGSAVPNPGRQAMAAVLLSPDGQRHVQTGACTHAGCNNEAELRALMLGLTRAQELGARSLLIHTDSSVLVEQLGPGRVPTIQRLHGLLIEAQALLSAFEHIQWQWVPRHRNAEADALARGVHGLQPKVTRTSKKRKPR